MAHTGYGKVSDVWLIQAILAKLIELTYITKPHKPTLRTYLPKSDRFLASKAMCILLMVIPKVHHQDYKHDVMFISYHTRVKVDGWPLGSNKSCIKLLKHNTNTKFKRIFFCNQQRTAKQTRHSGCCVSCRASPPKSGRQQNSQHQNGPTVATRFGRHGMWTHFTPLLSVITWWRIQGITYKCT